MLKKAAMNLLVKHLNPNEIRGLTKEFQNLDQDRTGFLTHREITEIIKKHSVGEGVTQSEIDEIINQIDYAGNQKINYSEFIAATLDVSKYLTE